MPEAIVIPQILGHSEFDNLLEQQKRIVGKITAAIPGEFLIFDFSENQNISMLGLLLIVKMADEFRAAGYICKAILPKVKQPNWIGYIMNLIKSEEPPQEIQDYLNSFRVPIKRCKNSKESFAAVNQLMIIIKNDVKPTEKVLKALNWALWEIVDNAGLHGYRTYDSTGADYSGLVYFCAAKLGEVIDIAILDGGQGIYSSFLSSGVKKYLHISNEDALKLSIKNEESGHPNGSPGFGLYGCSEIARLGMGQLLIISGNNKLLFSERGPITTSSSEYKGTMVSLRIHRDAAFDLIQLFGENSVLVSESIDDLIGEFK